MRTFVRALAFIAVFGIGLLLLLGGAGVMLSQQREEATPPQDSTRARANSWTAKVRLNESVAFFGGQLFISVVKISRNEAVTMVLSSPGRPSRTFEGQHVGDVVVYDDGRGGSEVRPTAIDILDAEFLVVPGAPPPRTLLDEVFDEARVRERASDLRMSGVLLSIAGFVLTISGIILAAVRPRQRQVVAKPVLGNAAVLASMARARPAVAPAPDPMAEPQAPPARPATPTFQGAMPGSGAPKPHAMKTTLWTFGIALISIGLLVSLFGTCQHNPHSRSVPAFGGRGFESSSGGDATAIIAGGVLVLITGAGLVVVAQLLRRGETPKP